MGAVDEPHVAPDDIPDHCFHQRVVRAAEHERIDFRRHERRQIVAGNRARRLGIDPTFFDQRDEERARLGGDRGVGKESFDLFLVGA